MGNQEGNYQYIQNGQTTKQKYIKIETCPFKILNGNWAGPICVLGVAGQLGSKGCFLLLQYYYTTTHRVITGKGLQITGDGKIHKLVDKQLNQ